MATAKTLKNNSVLAREAAELLQRLQAEKGISNRQLAVLSGMSHSTIGRIHSGGNVPGLDTYDVLLRCLGFVVSIQADPMDNDHMDTLEIANKEMEVFEYDLEEILNAKVTWHERRDGFGTVLGPYDGTGYPVLVNGGITLDDAREQFGDVTVGGEIPITIDRPTDEPDGTDA